MAGVTSGPVSNIETKSILFCLRAHRQFISFVTATHIQTHAGWVDVLAGAVAAKQRTLCLQYFADRSADKTCGAMD